MSPSRWSPASVGDGAERRAFANPTMTETNLRQMRAQQQQQYLQKMNQSQPAPRKLDLANLKTVRWAGSQALVREIYRTGLAKFNQAKKIALIGWTIVLTEMIVIWWWTLLHNLPWPNVALDLLTWADSAAFRVLDFLQQRLEWYQDAWGVRFMWLRESVEVGVDKGITVLDVYFGRLQDGMFYAVDIMMTPLRYGWKLADNFSKSSKFRKSILKDDSGRRGTPATKTFETEDEEDTEGWGDEDDMSDNSASGSKRIARKDMQDHPFPQTKMTPEERLRAAMQQRVRRELSLMRKHSIRFSRGIANYARQMVEPRIRPFAASFQDSCLRWAKNHGILDLMEDMIEEMKGRSLLGKALTLVRTLCAVCLAFLLRLAKGRRVRRTRSMRTESFRRRAQSLTSATLPLSPSALQQSSEPAAPLPQLEVPVTLPPAALKEEEEDLEGSLAKDSALGSEDNHSDIHDSDHAFPTIEEELEDQKGSPTSLRSSGFESDLAEDERPPTLYEEEEEEEEEQKKPVKRETKNNNRRSKKKVTIQ